MKTGKSLTQLATEIERQSKAKADYVAPARALTTAVDFEGSDTLMRFTNGKSIEMPINDHAHRQISEKLGIGAKYYDRMRTEAPHLLVENINHWLGQSDKTQLVRTLDGRVRAFLSNSYQRIDNLHVAEAVLPILASKPSLEVVSCEVTESKLYIKAIDHNIKAPVKGSRRVGDIVEGGVCIANSEIGLGAIQVMPFFNFLACLNGMVRNKEGLRAQHLGTKLDADDGLARLLSDDTRKHLDQGVLLKVRDVVTAAMDFDRFMASIRKMEQQVDPAQGIRGDPVMAVQLLAQEFHLVDEERSSVLRHLIEGGDLSQFGVMNAVTRTATDAPSYDRATELETVGGLVLDMAPGSWRKIAEAA